MGLFSLVPSDIHSVNWPSESKPNTLQCSPNYEWNPGTKAHVAAGVQRLLCFSGLVYQILLLIFDDKGKSSTVRIVPYTKRRSGDLKVRTVFILDQLSRCGQCHRKIKQWCCRTPPNSALWRFLCCYKRRITYKYIAITVFHSSDGGVAHAMTKLFFFFKSRVRDSSKWRIIAHCRSVFNRGLSIQLINGQCWSAFRCGCPVTSVYTLVTLTSGWATVSLTFWLTCSNSFVYFWLTVCQQYSVTAFASKLNGQ